MHFDLLKMGCICNRLIICICLKWVECRITLSVNQAHSFFIYVFFLSFSSHMDCSSARVFILMAHGKGELFHLLQPWFLFFPHWKVFVYNRNVLTTAAKEICCFDQCKWREEHIFVYIFVLWGRIKCNDTQQHFYQCSLCRRGQHPVDVSAVNSKEKD